jgi:hypothetical protein
LIRLMQIAGGLNMADRCYPDGGNGADRPNPAKPRHRAKAVQSGGEAIQRAVGHAVGLYRAVLEGLKVDPFAGLPGHDAPRH